MEGYREASRLTCSAPARKRHLQHKGVREPRGPNYCHNRSPAAPSLLNTGSPFLWIKYYKAGKPIRESTRTGDLGKAARFLRQRSAEVGSDPAESPRIEQLVDDLFRDYRIKEQRSLEDVQARWRLHLKPFLGSVQATQLDSRLLARYIDGRREEHASNATINRELACLKRMYRLAYLSTPPRVPSVPHFPHLTETNVRQGFVTPDQFAKLVAHCPDLWLRAMLETAITTVGG